MSIVIGKISSKSMSISEHWTWAFFFRFSPFFKTRPLQSHDRLPQTNPICQVNREAVRQSQAGSRGSNVLFTGHDIIINGMIMGL